MSDMSNTSTTCYTVLFQMEQQVKKLTLLENKLDNKCNQLDNKCNQLDTKLKELASICLKNRNNDILSNHIHWENHLTKYNFQEDRVITRLSNLEYQLEQLEENIDLPFDLMEEDK